MCWGEQYGTCSSHLSPEACLMLQKVHSWMAREPLCTNVTISAKSFGWSVSQQLKPPALGTRERGTAWGFSCWLRDDEGGFHWSDLHAESRLGDAHCFPKASICAQGSILMPGVQTIKIIHASVATAREL